MGVHLYSDQEEDPEELFEYNIGYNEDPIVGYDESGTNLFLQQGGMEPPPPLPPRMESRPDYLQQNNPMQYTNYQQQQQLQKQFHQQQQMQQQFQGAAPNQIMSPFGSVISKPQQRRSLAVDEMGDVVMTQSMNNELFIASFSDGDNSGEHKIQNKAYLLDNSHSGGSIPPMRNKQMNARNVQQKGTKKAVTGQADVNKFNVAVRNLQKHVVELDQAVNGITREVEDSKNDLSNIKSEVAVLKKEKDRLSDSVSIITQEATKMKEQVTSALKVWALLC